MSSRNRALLLLIRITSDVMAVGMAWLLAYAIRFHTVMDVPKGIPHAGLYLKLIPFIITIWVGVFTISGFYKRSMTQRSAFLEAIDILQSCVLATLTFIAFTYFYEEYRYSRITLFLFSMIHPWTIIAGRSLIRKALRIYRRRKPAKDVIVIGSGDILEHALLLPRAMDFAASRIHAVIGVGDEEELARARDLTTLHKVPMIEAPQNWIEFLNSRTVQTVIFALPQSAYGYFAANLEVITNQVPDVKVLPDFIKYSKLGAGIDIVQGMPVINIHESPLEGIGNVAKRTMDVLGASVALILLAPVMAIIAALVKLSSPGPMFYRQERMGLDGNTFYCLKFRSMPVDAESKTGPVWAKAGEARATKVGSFLRKYSFDELPQFINVFKGEMSLVGPRPERPVFVKDFRTKVPGYMLRHKVKAGITGWAQVNGWRGNTSIEKRIEYDLYYIQNWSIWLDIKIMALTVFEVFFSKNAY